MSRSKRLRSGLRISISTLNSLWPAPHHFHRSSSIVLVSLNTSTTYKPLHVSMPLMQRLWDKAQSHTSCASVGNVLQSPLTQEMMLLRIKTDVRIRKQQWLVPKDLDSAFSLAQGDSCVPDMTSCIRTLYPGNFNPTIEISSQTFMALIVQQQEIFTIRQVKHLRSSNPSHGQGAEARSITAAEDGQTTVDVVSLQGELHAL